MIKKPKILIVDDKLKNLIALETVLSNLNVETVQALSGNEALSKIIEEEFALVLMDVQMPDMDGFETVRLIREDKNNKFLPVIFISAIYSEDYYKIKGIESGAVDFIVKPIIPEILRGKIHIFIELYLNRKEILNTNAELKKLDDLKSEFVQTVSHELRTPLTIIREGVMLTHDGLLGEVTNDQREVLNCILDSIKRLSNIINNLLDISKLESGKVNFKKVKLHPASIVTTVIKDFMIKIQKKEVTIESELERKLLPIYGNSEKLIQVLINLVANALKFTKDIITISAKNTNDSVLFSVTDNGIGIAKEDISKIFGKFQQIKRVGGPGERGTGLGLAITKNLVELHKGKIWVESKKGVGSTFFFTIPKY